MIFIDELCNLYIFLTKDFNINIFTKKAAAFKEIMGHVDLFRD